jgi:hypothetical protein
MCTLEANGKWQRLGIYLKEDQHSWRAAGPRGNYTWNKEVAVGRTCRSGGSNMYSGMHVPFRWQQHVWWGTRAVQVAATHTVGRTWCSGSSNVYSGTHVLFRWQQHVQWGTRAVQVAATCTVERTCRSGGSNMYRRAVVWKTAKIRITNSSNSDNVAARPVEDTAVRPL